jgi:hypothetical protein
MLVTQFKLSTARMDLIHEVLIELKVLTSTTNTITIPEARLSSPSVDKFWLWGCHRPN